MAGRGGEGLSRFVSTDPGMNLKTGRDRSPPNLKFTIIIVKFVISTRIIEDNKFL
jgi:hypothetical protein